MRLGGGLALAAGCIATAALAAQDAPWGYWRSWGDQGDGSYRNPVLPADFSDLDAVRVGRDYYAISSTLHLSPGMAVLHSRDLVNWRMIGHVVPDLTVIGPQYRWDRMERLGRGVWAGSIRHHAGRFWVAFGTPDEGFFLSTAADPRGPWTPLHPLLKGAGWDDCSLIWDDAGVPYFVGTHFADGYKSYVMPMARDGRSLDRARAVLVNEGRGREASKLIRVGGWYYLIFSEHLPDTGRYVVARRARHPMGPWSEIRQIGAPNRDAYEPNQGALIEAPSGRTLFLTHHGRQDWEGRAASLLPVRWIDGWPIIAPAADGTAGPMVWAAAKPIAARRQPTLQAGDDFSASRMAPQWEWNHQPEPGSWSLTARRGWLRLHAFRPRTPGNLAITPNMPSQRSIRSPANSVIAKFDLSGMADGQHAGLAHVSNVFGAIGVRRDHGRTLIEYRDMARTVDGPPVDAPLLWLRTRWGSDGRANFAYSTDGARFTAFGAVHQMTRANYRGDRVALYAYGDTPARGHVDIDAVRYVYAGR